MVNLQSHRGGYKEEDFREGKPRFRQEPLISFLKEHTAAILNFAEALAQAIEQEHNISATRTHVLSGVYVPALHHLMSYQQPIDQHLLKPADQRRLNVTAWYLQRARDYLGAIDYGYPDRFWWHFLMRLSDLFESPPCFTSPQYSDGGRLIMWKFVFPRGEQSLALYLRDGILLKAQWLTREGERLHKFAKSVNATRAFLVANIVGYPDEPVPTATMPDDFVVDTDPVKVAEIVYKAFSTEDRSTKLRHDGVRTVSASSIVPTAHNITRSVLYVFRPLIAFAHWIRRFS